MMRWKSQAAGWIALVTVGAATVLGQQGMPEITGISHMSVYTSDPAGSQHFYGDILGAAKGTDPQDSSGVRFYFSATQFVEVLPLPAQHDAIEMRLFRNTDSPQKINQ